MTDVRDKVAFITGGASGIGLGIARALGGAGARLVLADVERGALERAREALASEGLRARTVQVDVSDREAMAAARDETLADLGAVHLLFNNAGVNVPGSFEDVSYADWDWVLGVNLGGVINGVMTFLPELVRHGAAAHVVNTASVGGLVGMPNLGIYNTSKFAVVGLSEALRADLRQQGVGVSVLCPGIVATSLGTSERNRPARLGGRAGADGGGDESVAGAEPATAVGTSPEALGRHVLAGVQTDAFFICTHPEFHDIVAERNAALMAAFGGRGEPDQVAAMRTLVVPF
jgi:NAD(P)-dependent dehydrogenase (short-subunit alcohol dehydrogenase family)